MKPWNIEGCLTLSELLTAEDTILIFLTGWRKLRTATSGSVHGTN